MMCVCVCVCVCAHARARTCVSYVSYVSFYNCVVFRDASTSAINKTMAESRIFWCVCTLAPAKARHLVVYVPSFCICRTLFAPHPYPCATTFHALSLPGSDRSALALSASLTISHEMSHRGGLITSDVSLLSFTSDDV